MYVQLCAIFIAFHFGICYNALRSQEDLHGAPAFCFTKEGDTMSNTELFFAILNVAALVLTVYYGSRK